MPFPDFRRPSGARPLRSFSRLILLAFAVAGIGVSSLAHAVGTGDYNNDDTVNVQDAIATLRAAVQIEEATPEQLGRADMNSDTKLDVGDAITILQIVVGIKPPVVDKDKDGYPIPEDCDDTLPGVNPGATDLPDAPLADTNCDGIDGTISRALFVSNNAGDDKNEGTREAPLKTVQAALSKSAPGGKDHIYVDAGTYTGPFTLKNGVSIWGAFSRLLNWGRNLSFLSTLNSSAVANGRIIGVQGENLTAPTRLGDLVITTTAPAANQFEISSYALYCKSCIDFLLERNTIQAADGTNGTPGKAGTPGNKGEDGGFPYSGSCDSNLGGPGGLGGGAGTATFGGNGGHGGPEGPHNGIGGDPGSGGAKGGGGGPWGDPGKPGTDGGPGAPGVPGTDGPGGEPNGYLNGFWTGFSGGNGTSGTDGQGGGGGGGGGGQSCSFCDDGTGNGCGGGGAGGTHGTFGAGGGPGGSSFGLFLVNSNGTLLIGNTIQSGKAGKGGSGGAGGDGGGAGKGILGDKYCTDEIGGGGNGGDGGGGGRGGHGGGGPGGDSYAVYAFNTVVVTAGNTLSHGTAGAGGISSGHAGAAGSSGDVK